MKDAVTFGEILKRWRNETGKTLEDVARETGLSYVTVSRLENGKTGSTEDTVSTLAECYGIPKPRAIRAFYDPKAYSEYDKRSTIAEQISSLVMELTEEDQRLAYSLVKTVRDKTTVAA